MNTHIKTLLPPTACFLLSGCIYGENKQFFEASTASQSSYSEPVIPLADPTPVATPTPPPVCNPFGSGSGGTKTSADGIKAKMYYYNSSDLGVYPTSHATDFYAHGHMANADFYFNDFDVPTRAFDQGFQLEDGSLLATDDGTKLFEYFAFDFKTSIRLPQGSGTKVKQFALMADDGATLIVQDPVTQVWTKQVNDDGQHASRLACGTNPVQVSSEFSVPIELQYFQGPRYHIALVLLWRDWQGSSFDPNDPWCGQSGNSLFFNSTTIPSTPSDAWIDLMSRWEVVPSDVFHIDADQGVNPCN